MVEQQQLTCPQCRRSWLCGPEAMLDWLRRVKKARRDTAAEPELIAELFRVNAGNFSCPECGARGLVASPASEDDADWPMARSCQECGRPIGRERVESLPDVRLCVDCQARADRGVSDTDEYCPNCGSKMVLRQTRTGIARYVLACPQCRR